MNRTTGSPRWVLVTGAGTGIGRFTAEYLAQNGFSVYAAARSEPDLAALGLLDRVVPVRLDVTRGPEIAAALELVRSRGTGLYGLVNNAGIAGGGPLAVLPDGDLEELFAVNLFGVHAVTKAFFPLIDQAQGRIVFIGSVMGFIAHPFAGPYCASKHALEAYADCLRRELFLTGVKVSLVQPGYVRSPLWAKSAARFAVAMEASRESAWQPHGDVSIRIARMLAAGSEKKTTPLARVAQAVYKGLSKGSPRARYLVTERGLKYRLVRLLPAGALDLYFKHLYRACGRSRQVINR